MSIVPLLLNDLLYEACRPSRLVDRQLGSSMVYPENYLQSITLPSLRQYSSYRPWLSNILKQDQGSLLAADNDAFQVSLDVQQFTPGEITVKTIDGSIVVEGKHEEKQDEHGFISRQFTRRYVLPSAYDIRNVLSSLSSDGVLTIMVPKTATGDNHNEKIIPITQTGPVKKQLNEEKAKMEEKKFNLSKI